MSATTHVSPRNTLAPWAEIVPNAPPMTVDDLESLPDDEGWVYELVQGVLVRMPMSGFEASRVGYRLVAGWSGWGTNHAAFGGN